MRAETERVAKLSLPKINFLILVYNTLPPVAINSFLILHNESLEFNLKIMLYAYIKLV